MVGVVGLGNMGSVLAANLAARRPDVVVHDLAGAERSPPGTTFLSDVAAVAEAADVVLLSLPDGRASLAVARALAASRAPATRCVVDTSTVGPGVAAEVEALLGPAGIALVDAPVSGGPAGAAARTLMVMYAGPDEACRIAEPVLADVSDRLRRVGARAGLGQVMKLANNFLSATALAATSEAVALGTAAGLEMGTMLEVLNAASGRSSATDDKFPNHVLTERYASGFTSDLMAKDLELYRTAALEAGGPGRVAAATIEVWRAFAAAEPGADFTRIHPFLAGDDAGGAGRA